jgi:hypothetical protein
LWEPFKDFVLLRVRIANGAQRSVSCLLSDTTAVGDGADEQIMNMKFKEIGGTCVSFSKAELSFPILFVEPPRHSICTGLNIATGIIAQLATSQSVHCVIANIAEHSLHPF